jgi:U3 small nucleolar RNA-associated protein 21
MRLHSSSSLLQIWDIRSSTCVTELDFPAKSFEISALAHPPTYKDKILFGSRQGTLQVKPKMSGEVFHDQAGRPDEFVKKSPKM